MMSGSGMSNGDGTSSSRSQQKQKQSRPAVDPEILGADPKNDPWS